MSPDYDTTIHAHCKTCHETLFVEADLDEHIGHELVLPENGDDVVCEAVINGDIRHQAIDRDRTVLLAYCREAAGRMGRGDTTGAKLILWALGEVARDAAEGRVAVQMQDLLGSQEVA